MITLGITLVVGIVLGVLIDRIIARARKKPETIDINPPSETSLRAVSDLIHTIINLASNDPTIRARLDGLLERVREFKSLHRNGQTTDAHLNALHDDARKLHDDIMVDATSSQDALKRS